jgi:hypothetical protein
VELFSTPPIWQATIEMLIMMMIGQAITVAAAIALLSTFLPAGAQGVTAELGEPFELMFGQEASVEPEGITVRFESVDEDSRCPSDVVCIQQGQATITISAKIGETDAGQHMLTIGADESKSSAIFNQYSVKMTDLQPYPVSTVQTDEEDYVATLVVSRASANSTGVFVKAAGDVAAAIAGWNLEKEKGVLVIIDRGEGTRTIVRFTPSAVECIGSAEARECIDGQITDVIGGEINQRGTVHFEVDGNKLSLAAGGTEYTLDIRQIRTRA